MTYLNKIKIANLSLGLLALLSSCNNSSDFDKYLENIGELQAPYFLDNAGKSIITKEFDKKLYEKYKVLWGYEPAGYLKMTDSTVAVLEYSFAKIGYLTFLTLYDLRGNKLDSINLFDESKMNERSSVEQSAFIHSDKIEITTTRSKFRRNSRGDILKKGFSRRSRQVKVTIADNSFQ